VNVASPGSAGASLEPLLGSASQIRVAKPKLKNQLVILLWCELASKTTLDLQTSSSVFGTNPALVLFTILDANFDKKRQDTAKCNEINGAGGGNRTHGLGIMRPSLYH
jgi:hypothetical protein